MIKEINTKGTSVQVPQEWIDAHNQEKKIVRELCEKLGFGNVMHLASETWKSYNLDKDFPNGGEFVVGPCRSLVVLCQCQKEKGVLCDWCCGSGWLTKKVDEIKDKYEKIQRIVKE